MYFIRVLIAIDQLINTLLGGQPDETISAKAWRTKNTPLITIIDKIFWFDPKHCEGIYKSEVTRRYLPQRYQEAYKETKNAKI